MALYNVYARPYIAPLQRIGFLTVGMMAGGGALILFTLVSGRVQTLLAFDAVQVWTGLYLAIGGGALGFFLWVVALSLREPDARRQHHHRQSDDRHGRWHAMARRAADRVADRRSRRRLSRRVAGNDRVAKHLAKLNFHSPIVVGAGNSFRT